MGASHRSWSTATAALIALLLLSYASIRSTVMQVEMASLASALPADGPPSSGVMAGMAMSGMAATPTKATATSHDGKPTSSRPAACPYCAAAAHLPVLTGSTVVRAPVAFIFSAFRVVSSHGPRGPPRQQPRARGPPADILTL